MPIDLRLYPSDWKVISLRIRYARAQWRCEWCGACQGQPHPITGSKVVLTVAHLGVAWPDGMPGDKTDKLDCRPENLAALCQRCHLNYDRADILITQARNRARKAEQDRELTGQLELWEDHDG